MGNLARQLEREGLEQELAARRRDFEGVDQKYRREMNPAEKNALNDQRNELLAEIQRIENQLSTLGVARDRELLDILQPVFQQHSDVIFLAYRYAQPSRQIQVENPHTLTLEQLIVNLKFSVSGNMHPPLHKFIGYLLFGQCLDIALKEQLGNWINEEIQDLDPLRTEIEQEQEKRAMQGNPYLLVSVSKRTTQYVAEAWIIDNPDEYTPTSVSGCHQIKIDAKAEWTIDPNLETMPDFLRKIRNVCVEQYCQKTIRQIHVFLPSEMISKNVDSWKSDDEEDGSPVSAVITLSNQRSKLVVFLENY